MKEYKSYYKKIGDNKNKMKKVHREQNTKNTIIVIVYQSIGAIILLGLFFILKNIPIEEANDIYVFSKNSLDQSVDIPQYKEIVLDKIDEFKKIIIGDKTQKEIIKSEYGFPIKGSYKKIIEKDNGIFIELSKKEDVISSFDGIVDRIMEDEYGKSLVINNGNGVETYYSSLSKIEVSEGDKVSKESKIGESGTNGLFFKIIYMGIEKNPLELLNVDDENNLL